MKKALMAVAFTIAFVMVWTGGAECRDVTGLNGAGFKIGLNLANFTGSDAEYYSDEFDQNLSPGFRAGLTAGGFATIGLHRNIAFQTEVLYVMKGSTYNVDMDGQSIDVTFKLDYLEVPLLLMGRLPNSGRFTPSIYLGPALAFKLSSKIKGSAENASAEANLSDVKGTDIGLVLGLGTVMELPRGGLTFDMRYTIGLTDIWDYTEEVDWKNTNIQFLIGYSY